MKQKVQCQKGIAWQEIAYMAGNLHSVMLQIEKDIMQEIKYKCSDVGEVLIAWNIKDEGLFCRGLAYTDKPPA